MLTDVQSVRMLSSLKHAFDSYFFLASISLCILVGAVPLSCFNFSAEKKGQNMKLRGSPYLYNSFPKNFRSSFHFKSPNGKKYKKTDDLIGDPKF